MSVAEGNLFATISATGRHAHRLRQGQHRRPGPHPAARRAEAGRLPAHLRGEGLRRQARPAAASAPARPGAREDVVVVHRLDRLARSTRDLLEIAEQLREAGAGLRSLGEPWADTTSPAGRMVLTVFAGIAEFERALIQERTGGRAGGRQAARCALRPARQAGCRAGRLGAAPARGGHRRRRGGPHVQGPPRHPLSSSRWRAAEARLICPQG